MSVLRVVIMPNTYRDSVYLMKLSSQACKESGALEVSAMMGSERNKELFRNSDLSTPEVEQANADDLVIAVRAEESTVDAAMTYVRSLLDESPSRPEGNQNMAFVPHTVDDAVAVDPQTNLAIISVAGDYARYEAARALSANMDVMLYSDNISIADELALKKLAIKKNLLVMGPDCGTAIIDGIPLAFANRISRGPIGLIGASGTGMQEVICLLDRFGSGISQAYGTGGRDLKDEIGGLTALAALDRLVSDEQTRLIGILGKTPGKQTRVRLAEKLRHCGKPAIVHFLGTADYGIEDSMGIPHTNDLTELAVSLLQHVGIAATVCGPDASEPVVPNKWMRGLFSGGTLCQEAAELAAPILGEGCSSNLPIQGFNLLSAGEPSTGHAFWDFGADEFTVGRPHPMMAPELRMERLVRELCDPDVGVVLLDMVIGYGAASNQAELMAEALTEAARRTDGRSRQKMVVTSVCGTEKDTPSRSAQVQILRENGVAVLESNARAAVWAARVAAKAAKHISGGCYEKN